MLAPRRACWPLRRHIVTTHGQDTGKTQSNSSKEQRALNWMAAQIRILTKGQNTKTRLPFTEGLQTMHQSSSEYQHAETESQAMDEVRVKDIDDGVEPCLPFAEGLQTTYQSKLVDQHAETESQVNADFPGHATVRGPG